MKTIPEIKEEIKVLQDQIDNFELDPYDFEDSYREFLDEMEGDIKVAGITFQASRIIEELDPTAFRCGLLDYIDGIDPKDSEDYQALVEELEQLESELEEMEADTDEE